MEGELQPVAVPELKSAAADIPAADAEAAGFHWCIVEIFGHRQHAGRGREEDKFGSRMLRVDELTIGAGGRDIWETFYYGGGSIFSFRPITEELARKNAVRRYPPFRSAAQIEDRSTGNDEPDMGW